ncbi:MAG: HigA family addiction module antitoxin [Candidatus Melainabacteria bacterium]
MSHQQDRIAHLPKRRPPVHPGELLLEEFLRPMGISQREFAKHIGWNTTKLNEIINGRRGLSLQSILDLADVFAMSAGFWLNLQTDYDLWHAVQGRRKKSPLKKAI